MTRADIGEAGQALVASAFRAMGTDVTVLVLDGDAGARVAGRATSCGGGAWRSSGSSRVEPLPADERAVPPQRRRGRAGDRVAGDVRPRRPGRRGVAPHRASLRPDDPARGRGRRVRPQLRRSRAVGARASCRRATGGPAPGCAASSSTASVRAIRLPPGVALDLGGIGKGYAADLVAPELSRAPGAAACS